MRINISSDFDVHRKRYLLYAQDFNKAVSSAINKVTKQAFTDTRKNLTRTYTFKSADVTKALSISKSNKNYLTASIYTTKLGQKQMGFAPKQFDGATVTSKGIKLKAIDKRPKGVKIYIKKGAPETFKHAFVAKMQSGHIAVFERDTSKGKKYAMRGRYAGTKIKRYSIKEIKGPSIGYLFGSDKIELKIHQFIKAKMPAVFEHELAYYMNKAKGLGPS